MPIDFTELGRKAAAASIDAHGHRVAWELAYDFMRQTAWDEEADQQMPESAADLLFTDQQAFCDGYSGDAAAPTKATQQSHRLLLNYEVRLYSTAAGLTDEQADALCAEIGAALERHVAALGQDPRVRVTVTEV